MKVPVRFYIPILAVLSVAGVIAVVLHGYLSSDKSRTVEFFTAVVGGITALYSLLLSVHQRRSTAAAEFVKRWNQPDFDPYRQAIRTTIDENSAATVEAMKTIALLSFWEEVSIAILRREADESLLKEFFYTVATRYYIATEDYIEKRRKEKKHPTASCEFEKLYRRWSPKSGGG